MREFIAGVLICVVIVVVIAVLKEAGPADNARGGEHYLRTLVFEFQTLLTGILAVAAAYLTVLQMRASDEKSDSRHLQTMKAASEQHKASMRLALRGDRLRVHRALHPQFRELRDIKKRMEAIDTAYRLIWNDPEMVAMNAGPYSKEDFERLALSVYPLIAQVKQIFERPQVQEGAKLFDGDLTFRIDDIIKETERVEPAARFFYGYYYTDPEERPYEADTDYVTHVNHGNDRILIRYPRVFTSKIGWILEGMREMAKIYDVEERWTD